MKTKFITNMAIIAFAGMFLSGCVLTDWFAKEKTKTVSANANPANDPAVDKNVRERIQKYYEILFNTPVDEAYKANVNNNILSGTESFLAESVKKDKVSTPEFPIHYPRFIELNGLTCYKYQLIRMGGKPEVEAKFYETSDDKIYKYLTTVTLLAKVVKNADFGTYYKFNDKTKTIDRVGDVPEDKADSIKITAKYDVWMKEESSKDYKIIKAIESTNSANIYRLNKINNTFVTRIPFLDKTGGEDFTNFQMEKAYVESFMTTLMTKMDKAQTGLFVMKWNTSPAQLSEYLNSIGILKDSSQNPYFYNLEDANSYQTRFNVSSLPIKPGIESILKVEISIDEHPSFTEKQRVYRVEALATVKRSEGDVGNPARYAYDYTVNLMKKDGKLSVNSFKLNSFKLIRE